MADYITSEDFMEEFLQCAVCLEVYNEPKLLPCQHSFCTRCLQALPTGK